MSTQETFSNAWFDETFTDPVTREPIPIPADIRRLSERICRSYSIRGVCDPMYIANVIAFETGRGDGYSHFDGAPCGIQTLGPDDSIRPCRLVKGHEGFCDTGVR